MADDAAGAVRRTPRTDDNLDTFRCHEPFHRDAEVRVSFTGRYYAGAFMGSHIVDADDHHRCTVPPDAVTLLPDGDVVERAARPLAVNALRRYEAEQGFADHLTADDFMTNAREDVRALAADSLLNDPERGRPVVLLRAEDCACPVGGDCPHGPEPVDALDLAVWLHAEAAWRVAGFDAITVKLAQINQRVTAERDEAVALCANLQATLLSRLAELTEVAGKQRSTEWLRTCATLPIEEWPPAPAYKGPMVPAAERDALQARVAELQGKLTQPCGECHPCSNWSDETWRRAGRKPPSVVTWEDKLAQTRDLHNRLDDAIKLIEEMAGHLRQDAALTIGVETRLAALRADEPSEPEAGCMDGPAKQHTLHMVGIIKALKSAAGMDHLPLEPPRRDNFARLARAIADYWPREIDRPTSEPTGEADRG